MANGYLAKNACYYKKDLLNNKGFSVVGQVDLEKMIIRGILNAIKDGDST